MIAHLPYVEEVRQGLGGYKAAIFDFSHVVEEVLGWTTDNS
jgi:hypothetical protein